MSEIKKIVILGGNAMGMSTAARCRRLSESSHITVFEKTSHPSAANCALPYFIGGEMLNKKKLQVPLPLLQKGYNLDLRLEHEVMKIDLKNKLVLAKNLKTNETVEEKYDKLVLGLGSNPFVPPIPGIKDCKNIFTLRHVEDMDLILERMKDAKNCLVLGCGFIGVELLEQIRRKGLEVTGAELLPHIVPPIDGEMAHYLQKELTQNGVKIMTSTVIDNLKFDEEKNQVLATLKKFPNGPVDSEATRFDFIVVSCGVRPNTTLLKEAGIKLNDRGSCLVDEHMLTSDKDVYGGGDMCVVKSLIHGGIVYSPLANSANIQGRVMANHMFGVEGACSTYRGTTQTGMFKCFGLTCAMIGDSEEALKRKKMEHGKDYFKFYTAEHHVPMFMYQGAGKTKTKRNICQKLLFTKEGKILGFQAIGEKGVYPLTYAMSTAVWSGLKVQDLEMIELPYHPFGGMARSSLNLLGQCAMGILRGMTKLVFMEDVIGNDNVFLIDIRAPWMRKAFGHIPGSVNVPIGALRKKLSVIKEQEAKGKQIVVSCNIGKKAYTASKMLHQLGFPEVKVLSGSYFIWKRCYSKE